jgi:hypothetical protein
MKLQPQVYEGTLYNKSGTVEDTSLEVRVDEESLTAMILTEPTDEHTSGSSYDSYQGHSGQYNDSQYYL